MKILAAFLSAVAVTAAQAYWEPGPNLVRHNIPAVPIELADRIDQFAEFRSAYVVSWHPLKREMLMHTRFCSTEQIHELSMPLGARKQLTFFRDTVRSASFQPTKGEYFVFHKDKGGDEFFQLYRYDLKGKEIVRLTDGKSRNTGGVWSCKGDRIAYGSTRRNGTDVDLCMVNPLDPNSDHIFVQLNGGGWVARDWTPDDQSVIAEQEISSSEGYLWIIDTASGAKRLLTPGPKEEKASYNGGQISPDGRIVYTITDRGSQWSRLTAVDVKTGKHAPLTSHINWDIDEFRLSRDGKYIAYTSNEHGYSVLRVLATESGKETKIEHPVGIVGGLVWHPNNKELGYSLDTTKSPANIYSIDVTDFTPEKWTDTETGTMPVDTFAEPELVKWHGADKKEISGFLYKPNSSFKGKRPVVIQIHGGPESQFRPHFLGRVNYFINDLGVAYIFPNIRGSSGFGKSFLRADDGFKRIDSYQDIGALLDWIATREDLDPDRVMVTGTSYGGHMTLVVSAMYSYKIRCALDIVGMSNLVTFLQNTQGYRRDLRRAEYGDERDPKMRAFLEKIAPMYQISQIKKPLFIVQGKNDPRVPISESDQIVEALQKRGTAVWYLVATDEGHGFSKRTNSDYLYYVTALFMKNFLLN